MSKRVLVILALIAALGLGAPALMADRKRPVVTASTTI